MGDGWAVALALAAAAGALVPSQAPPLLMALLVLVALRLRSPLLLCLAVALCASGLAQRALDGLDGVREAEVAGRVTLVSDPEPSYGGVRADARLGGRRVELQARGTQAAALGERLAGEVVTIRGDLSQAPADAPWLRARHVSGRLRVLSVEASTPGAAPARIVNFLRRTLERGAAPMSDRHRSLFTGLVIGDDRDQPATLADDFLGAGMTHLLAVSGQNVAFVLAICGPLLRRLRLWPRLVVTLVVIAGFGLLTRFEPSVLRASAMAALAALVTTAGTPASRTRVIALAVTGLLLVDPLLVHSAGFRLSVSAAAAIVVLAPSIVRVLPGPAGLREALAVTVAAQLGVAPVLLATFGPIPLASVPANLLAVPVAGLVMVWGATAGLVAGALGGTVAGLVHLPTSAALRWLEIVAARASDAPLGELGWAHVLAVAAGLLLVAAAREHPWARRAGAATIGAAVVASVLVAGRTPPLRTDPLPGLSIWRSGGSEVVAVGGAGRSAPASRPVLEALRRSGVSGIDLLIVTDDKVPELLLDDIADGRSIGSILTYGTVSEPVLVEVGQLEVSVVPVPGRLVAEARPGR